MTKAEKKSQDGKKSFLGFSKLYLTKVNLILGLVLAMVIFQLIQLSNVWGSFTALDTKGSSLVDEVGKLKEMVSTIGLDLNDTRGFLAMPTRNYSQGDLQSSDESIGDTLQVALFDYVNYLGNQEKLKENIDNNLNLLKALADKDFVSYLAEKEASITNLEESEGGYHLSILDSSKTIIFYLSLDEQTGNLTLNTPISSEQVKETDPTAFVQYVRTTFDNDFAKTVDLIKKLEEKKAYITSAFKDGKIAKLLTDKKLTFVSEPETKDFKFYYKINNFVNDPVAYVVLDKKILSITLKDVGDENNISVEVTDLNTALPPFVAKINTLPATQKKVAEAQDKLRETFEDAGFKLLLKEAGLSVSAMREDSHRYYYDIKSILSDGKENLLGSVVIEKSTGLVEVVDPSGAGTINLLFFKEGLKKKL